MLLYKFKSLTPLERVLDILLHERLYCAPYHSLNDPFEGLFLAKLDIDYSKFVQTDEEPEGSFIDTTNPDPFVVTQSLEMPTEIKYLVSDKTRDMRVCSLSRDYGDVRLWSHYADSHQGVAIEIDFLGNEGDIASVVYSPSLQQYRYASVGDEIVHSILLHKTIHWDYETEHRIIGHEKFYPIAGRIRSIYCGIRTSDEAIDLLRKATGDRFRVVRTRLDPHSVRVVEQEPLSVTDLVR